MKSKKNRNGGLVYSTAQGQMCPDCGKPKAQCKGHLQTRRAKGDGVVRVGRETKGRKGKGVTVITGIPLSGDGLAKLAKQLKQRCGAGGTVKGGTIEIQGEHRDVLVKELSSKGYTVKRSGG